MDCKLLCPVLSFTMIGWCYTTQIPVELVRNPLVIFFFPILAPPKHGEQLDITNALELIVIQVKKNCGLEPS